MKTEAPTKYVYKVDQLDLTDFHIVKEYNISTYVGECVKAALAVRKAVPSMADWDGGGDYFFAPVPGKGLLVVCRQNPYSEGYIVSPVELPWLAQDKVLNG